MPDLRVEVNGIRFPNPVLTAAGPNVRTGTLMLAASRGGAGGLVSKTICPRPARDPRPTIRRTAGGGLLNCESWSEIPPDSFIPELLEAKESGLPLIVSIGYMPGEVSRLGKLIEKEVQPAALEFSTHYTGRSLGPLLKVARSLRRAVQLPIWMKVSPAIPDLEGLAIRASPWVDAFVAVNSFGPALDFDLERRTPLLGAGAGWLSGPPLQPIALRVVSLFASCQAKPVIGVGGIEQGEDAIKFFMAGASLVQVCSAAIRRGHKVYGRIAAQAGRWLEEHGCSCVAEIRGAGLAPARGTGGAAAGGALMSVDETLCTGCRACLERCVHGALSLQGDKARVDETLCIGCGFCQDFCAAAALRLKGD